MLLGHYGVALAAKRYAPATSLGTTVLAAQWLDELWPFLLLLGVERVRIGPGFMPASPLEFVHYPYSHSLLLALIWGVSFGVIYRAARRSARGALVVALLVVSHWLLDLPMHAPDLPLWPGSPVELGLGMWNSIAATIAIEGVVFLGGLTTYLRGTRPRDRIGTWSLWAMVAVLVMIFATGFVSPPPPNERVLAFSALGLWLFVPWAALIDRHREVVRA